VTSERYLKLDFFLKFLLVTTVFLIPLLFSQSTYNPCAIKLVFLRSMLVIGCIVWLLNSFIKSRFEFVRTKLNLPILLFVFMGIISFVACPFKSVAYNDLSMVLSGGVLFFLVVNSIKDRKSFDYIIGAIALSFILVVSFSFMQYFGINKIIAWGGKEFASTMGQKNIFAAYGILVFPVLGSILILSKSKWLKSILLIFLLISVYCLILAKSRSGYLGFMTAIIVYSVLWLRTKNKNKFSSTLFIIITAVFIGAGVAGYFAHGRITEYLSSFMNEPSIVMRKILWAGAVNIIMSFPLFGTGIGTFTIFSPLYRDSVIDLCMPPEVFDIARCHNEFLQLTTEQGILGLLLFIYILYVVFRMGLAVLKSKPDIYIIGLISGLAGLLIQSMFSISMRTTVPAVYFWMFCGLITVRVNIVGGNFKIFRFDINIRKLWRTLIIIVAILIGSIYFETNLRTFRSHMYFGKAVQLERLDNTGDAKNACIKAISLNKNNPQIYYKLGALYAIEKKWAMAEKAYGKVIQIHPNYGIVNINLGFVLYKQGKIEEGIMALRKGVILHNRVPKYHNMLNEMRLIRTLPK